MTLDDRPVDINLLKVTEDVMSIIGRYGCTTDGHLLKQRKKNNFGSLKAKSVYWQHNLITPRCSPLKFDDCLSWPCSSPVEE